MNTTTVGLAGGIKSRQLLGYGGLLPFVGCLALMLLAEDPAWQDEATTQLRYYAALIASFLGAIHWGTALDGEQRLQTARLVWGITPALMAWPLLSLPPDIAFAGFAALFAFIVLVDCYLLPLLDDEFRRLRLKLSILVIACLITAALTAPGTVK